jgi:hypothetical protein
MIPREILKKIRQIEPHTNRIVTEFAPGTWLCEPQHSRIAESQSSSWHVLSGEAAAGRRPALRSGARASARFTARTPAASKTNLALNSIRPLKRRERRAPVSRNSKPIEFEGFRNYGEFAIIRNQEGETCPVLVPSNSTGLESPATAISRN